MMHKAYDILVDINDREPRPNGEQQRLLEKIPRLRRIHCSGVPIGLGTMNGWVWFPAADEWFSPDQKRVVEAECLE